MLGSKGLGVLSRKTVGRSPVVRYMSSAISDVEVVLNEREKSGRIGKNHLTLKSFFLYPSRCSLPADT